MTLKEREERNSEMMGEPLWWILVIISAVLFVAGCEGYKSCCRHMDKQMQEEKMERQQKEIEEEINREIHKGYDFSAGQTSKTCPKFPAWSDCGGDYKACRQLLLKNLDIVNTDSKYRNWAYIVHPEIKGDVLWLYSMHFKERYIRQQVVEDLNQMFIDCKFKKVMAAITRTKNQGYWEIWEGK